MVGNLNGRKSHSASLVSGLEHGRNAAKKKEMGNREDEVCTLRNAILTPTPFFISN